PSELGVLFSGGSVSFNISAMMTTIKTPINARKIKILCQFVNSNDRIAPPAIGAIIGATALMTIKSAKNFVSALPLKTSRTTALDKTTPAAAVKPCTKRAAINVVILGAKAQSTDASAKREVAINKGFLLPWPSLIGPMTTCPIARPRRHEVRLDCTIVALVPRSSAMPGNAGRYISILSGPKSQADQE